MFNFKKTKIVTLIVLLFSLTVVPLKASDTEIQSINIESVIDENGVAHFTETWNMNVNEGSEVYKTFSKMGDKKLSLEEVKEGNKTYTLKKNWDSDLSRSEKKNKAGINTIDDGYEICMGIGSYGKKTYTFKYSITQFVNQYSETQGINYAFMGDMSLNVKKVVVDISSQKSSFTADNSKIWGFGYEGRCDYLENGHIKMVTNGRINKVQLLSSFNETYTSPSNKTSSQTFESVKKDALEGSSFSDEESNVVYDDNDNYSEDNYDADDGDFFSFLVICGGFLTLFSTVILYVYKEITRVYKPYKNIIFEDGSKFDKKDVSMFRDLPTKDLIRFYYLATKVGLINDNNKSGLMSAFILRWVKDNKISFVKGEKVGFIKKRDSYQIDFTKKAVFTNTFEQKLYNMFRKASGSNLILETKEFEDWCRYNYDDIIDWFDDIEKDYEDILKKEKKIKVKTTYKNILGLQIPRKKTVYRLSMKDEFNYVYGFYKFLKNQDNMKEKEVIEVYLWEEYLMYATILGIADEVEKQLKMIKPNFREEIDITYYDTYMISRMFVYSGYNKAVSAYQSANSGSSFSGGGGGSSFGGGGGGFSGGGGGGVR